MLLEEIANQNSGANDMRNSVTKESVEQIVVDFLKQRKSTEKVDVTTVEEGEDVWIIRGTCPIDLEGHPWAERFEVVVDTKGRIKSTEFALL